MYHMAKSLSRLNDTADGGEEQDMKIGSSREFPLVKGIYSIQGAMPSICIVSQASKSAWLHCTLDKCLRS